MGFLTRNKVYEKIAPNKDAKKVYIVCEGQVTEYNYFNYFKGFSSNIDIPIPSLNGQTDPLKLKEQAISLFFGNMAMILCQNIRCHMNIRMKSGL